VLALIRFAFRWALRLVAFAIVLTVAVVLFRDALLREWLLFRLRSVTGLETELAAVTLNLSEASLTLDQLRLRNSPEFGGSWLLVAPRLRFELDTAAFHRREIRLRSAEVHLAEASAVRSADGRTNVFALQDAVNRNASLMDLVFLGPPGFTFEGIDTLDLTLGTLHLVDLQPPGFHQPIPLGITHEVVRNVRSTEDLHPLFLRVLIREITAGISEGFRTNRPPRSPNRAVP
jgi:hypothetical protein